eukprot:127455-Chlamydomonas_euryale.AAC.1
MHRASGGVDQSTCQDFASVVWFRYGFTPGQELSEFECVSFTSTSATSGSFGTAGQVRAAYTQFVSPEKAELTFKDFNMVCGDKLRFDSNCYLSSEVSPRCNPPPPPPRPPP